MAKEWIEELNKSYDLQLGESLSEEEALALLAEKFNVLIRSDLNALIQFLYRMDVSETRLRTLLKTQTDEDTGLLIARLVLERLQQKILTRRQFQNPSESDEERW
jgi:hypothetical protein